MSAELAPRPPQAKTAAARSTSLRPVLHALPQRARQQRMGRLGFAILIVVMLAMNKESRMALLAAPVWVLFLALMYRALRETRSTAVPIDYDAERIRATGTPAIQVNTGKGCHLDAQMVTQALGAQPAPRDGVLFIRNSTTGVVEARTRKGHGIALNDALHAND